MLHFQSNIMLRAFLIGLAFFQSLWAVVWHLRCRRNWHCTSSYQNRLRCLPFLNIKIQLFVKNDAALRWCSNCSIQAFAPIQTPTEKISGLSMNFYFIIYCNYIVIYRVVWFDFNFDRIKTLCWHQIKN